MTRHAGLVLFLLVALALLIFALFPSRAASDVPVSILRNAGMQVSIPQSAFEAIRTAGITVVGTTYPSPAVLQPRTLSPAPSPAPATLAPSMRAVPRLASVRSHASATVEAASGSAPAAATATGTASTYGPGYDGYLALPSGPGHRVRICGAGGCIVRVSNDAGPSLAMQRLGRIVDLSVADFEAVCGVPWTRGLCRVSVAP